MEGFCIFYNILLVEYPFLRNHSQTTDKMRCNLSNYSCFTNNFQRILTFQRRIESYATEWKWNSLENESIYKYFLELLYMGVKNLF